MEKLNIKIKQLEKAKEDCLEKQKQQKLLMEEACYPFDII